MSQLFSVDEAGKLFMTMIDKGTQEEYQVPLGPVSAYALALQQGYEGTLDQWLNSLREHPPGGEPGQFIVRSSDPELMYEWYTIENATQSKQGYMSPEDKKFLDLLGKLELEGATTITVGGVKAGTEFPEGISVPELIKAMLYPKMDPIGSAKYNLDPNVLYSRDHPEQLTSVTYFIQACTSPVSSFDLTITGNGKAEPQLITMTLDTPIPVDGVQHSGTLTLQSPVAITDSCTIEMLTRDEGGLSCIHTVSICFGSSCYIGTTTTPASVSADVFTDFDASGYVNDADYLKPEFDRFAGSAIPKTMTVKAGAFVIAFTDLANYEVYDQNFNEITGIFTKSTVDDYTVLVGPTCSTTNFTIYFYPHGKGV